MSELKPCPFCGGKPQLQIGTVEFIDAEVSCQQCGVVSGNYGAAASATKNRLDAIAAWNRRAPDWQPIETAPRDRRTILVWCDGDCYAVSWSTWLDDFGDPLDNFEGWAVSDNKNDPLVLRGGPPSHWRPLPDGPTT